jgi:hypothetical protein
MKNSHKKESVCSLCHNPKHRAGSSKCKIVGKYQSTFVSSASSQEFAKSLGNPAKHLVDTASPEDRVPMIEWLTENNDIPSSAQHIVICRCFYAASADQSYQANPVEVTLLQHGGSPLDDHEVCYFPAHKICHWIERNCLSKQRKRHVLSSLQEPSAAFSQEVYNYSPGN